MGTLFIPRFLLGLASSSNLKPNIHPSSGPPNPDGRHRFGMRLNFPYCLVLNRGFKGLEVRVKNLGPVEIGSEHRMPERMTAP